MVHLRPAVALVATLLLAGCGGDDGAVSVQPPTGSGDAGTNLTVVLDEDGEGSTRTFTLTCDPPGGEHPDPEAACAALAEAGGVAAFAPVPDDVACTEVYGGPQAAQVTGTVDGTEVEASFSRVNGCEIDRWDALAPLLGTQGGVQDP
jgi:hypothetical protein